MNEYIKVYAFHNAPNELKKLSRNGGDEDWIAIVPKSMSGDHIWWLQEGTPFGCCCVEEHILETGDIAYIGCHS